VKTVVKRRKRKLNSDDDSDYDPSATEATSEHNTGMDVDSGDEDEEINVSMYKMKKNWKSGQYIKECSVDAYTLENDVTLPHFHTQVQQDAFFGVLLDNKVFRHKYID
jgi:hypothetical protein